MSLLSGIVEKLVIASGVVAELREGREWRSFFALPKNVTLSKIHNTYRLEAPFHYGFIPSDDEKGQGRRCRGRQMCSIPTANGNYVFLVQLIAEDQFSPERHFLSVSRIPHMRCLNILGSTAVG